MNILKPLTAALALAIGSLAAPAWAQEAPEATTTFDVFITIESTCSINTPAATDVNFGSVLSTATDVQSEGSLSVNCTEGTDYQITLNAGENGTDIDSRAMSDGAGNSVAYQLYHDSDLTTPWGDTPGSDTYTAVGAGEVQEVTVYGLVPSANSPAGDYSDTVTATVIW